MDGEKTIQPRDELPAETVVFGILANTERRALLRYLVAHGPVVRVDDLAEQLATLDAETDRVAGTADLKKTVLVHTHLPKLAAADLLDWQAGDEEVRATSLLDEFTVTTPMTGNFLDMTVSHVPARQS